jgi:hypothetical protein
VKVFVASALPTDYPWKLQKPSTVSPRVRETAEEFILDSGIGDDVSTDELLDLAARFDPDYLVAKDELHDHDTTTENTVELLDRINDAQTDAEVLVPLQPPYTDHYRKLRERGITDHKYVLGGLAVPEVDTAQALEWIHKFREVAPDVYAHGLGIGGGIEIVEALAGREVLDSIDCATPEMAAINGCALDTRLRQNELMAFPGGEGRSDRVTPLAEFNSWQIRDVWATTAARDAGLDRYV